MTRRVVPAPHHRPDPIPPSSGDKHDHILISSAICNGDDLGPFVRKAFSSGKPDSLLHSLRAFSRSKESEIEEVCKAHYQDFIRAVDDLRSLLSDVDSLKSSLSDSNSLLRSVASPLLSSLDAFVEARVVARNVSLASDAVRACVRALEACARANEHLADGNLYMALRSVDAIERDHLPAIPSSTLRRMLDRTIPAVRSHAERRIAKEFGDWLVQIRVASRNLGQIAIGQASAARQREEDLRTKQRQAEEQSRLSTGLRDCVTYSLQEDDDDEIGTVNDVVSDHGDLKEKLGFDLTPLYRAYHIHQTLGLQDRFKAYYIENRKLQLTSDFQVSSMTPFLESHQTFFAQIVGFFIVEDRILRTGGGLISRSDVDNLWETAVAKMCSVLEDQFSRMQTANHLLLIKDYVSLLGVTLRRYGYLVEPLLDVLNKHRDKYHELLLSDCRAQIAEVLAADKFEQMLMKKEYEYSMNVLAFQLQTSDIVPAFPYVAPFSSTVPGCCRIVRSFIVDSVSFMSHGGQLDFYDVVRRYLDRLLGEVLDGALLRFLATAALGVSQAMQVAANMAALERACDFFFKHAAQLSGIPSRVVERGGAGRRRVFPLKKSRDAAEELLAGLLRTKVDDFMLLTENVNWMGDDPPQYGNEYANEVIIYLETLVSTAQQILPVQVLNRVLLGILAHISENIVGFNANAVTGFDTDIRLFESFADNQAHLFVEDDGDMEVVAGQLRGALAEARQLVNLLMSSHPESFLNPVIRGKNYDKLDYKKVVTISEKFRDSSDRLFSTFGTRGMKPNPKKKSLDTLIKRLKDVS
ncbi:putative exocyst complex component 6 [Acorus calamus]|uniref:Exocyst complex component n=1 Tax=Acorus calamus TaxID=4465 RepID=A0AAV9ET21_ACOCL|nr:putative exocyst complex component 6 [Acorus calamus]